MGEYEPRDSRNVTQSTHRAPGEPPRTGPREGESRDETGQPRQQTELEQDERDADDEATVSQAEAEQATRDREHDDARFDRND